MLVVECGDWSMERGSPTEPFVDCDCKCVLVAGSAWLPAKLFGSHVAGSSRRVLCRERDHALDNYGNAKIAQDSFVLLVEETICWLDILMDDVLCMGLLESGGNLLCVSDTLVQG